MGLFFFLGPPYLLGKVCLFGLVCIFIYTELFNKKREMFCMRKNSYRKCSRTGGGGVTRFAKDGPSYSFAKRERGEQEGPRFRFSFSLFLGTRMSLPTCSQYRRRAQDPQCRRCLYTTCTQSICRPIFFFALLPSFPPASPRSINGRTENSLAPEIVSFCLSFSLFFFSFLRLFMDGVVVVQRTAATERN